MYDWFVQVKECGGDGGGSILLCGKGYRQHPQRGLFGVSCCVCCRVLMVGNRHIMSDKEDVLFHFGLSTASHDLRRMFSDVKVGSRSFALVFFSVICYRTHFRQFLLPAISEIVIPSQCVWGRERNRQTDRQTDRQRELIT